MKIFVDADGCPVIAITEKIARANSIPLIIVKNYAHSLTSDYGEIITVDISPDSADFYILNHILKGDILVTQDQGLMAMAMAKEALVINENGFSPAHDNIDFILNNRHISKKLRQEQRIYFKKKKREPKSDSLFENALISLIDLHNNGVEK